jgi:hypothetical protein
LKAHKLALELDRDPYSEKGLFQITTGHAWQHFECHVALSQLDTVFDQEAIAGSPGLDMLNCSTMT